MLLNPGRAESPKAGTGRPGGGFSGLVRHVIELSAVGELPLPLEGGSVGEEGVDEPVGCVIEYMLPPGQVCTAPRCVSGLLAVCPHVLLL